MVLRAVVTKYLLSTHGTLKESPETVSPSFAYVIHHPSLKATYSAKKLELVA